MIWFVFGIFLLIASFAWFLFAPKGIKSADGYHDAISWKQFGFIGVILGVLCIVLSCFAIVGTRNVGVATVFSRPTGDNHGSGLIFKAPWVSIHDIDATVQVEEYKGDDCIKVKIADGGTACIWVTYRWRINPDGADKVYADYRKSDEDIVAAVKKALVSTNIKAALNEVWGKFDPLAGANLTPDMTAEEIANLKINVVPDYEQINNDIETNVNNKIEGLGDLIDIQSVTVSFMEMPDATQKKINAFNQAVQDTKIALQQVATKKAQAQGNLELAASLADPNVLVSQCFTDLAAGNITAPAGFSCWPGDNGAVVVPATK